ncbi:MAG: UDP-N-acetylmuramate dehydrogenase [Candidatus Lernaella stagnicola]|nr:UDP-N-acetylmuramate dehydrogenase [Candidatus Lernaella stagnicola]
MIGIRAQKRLTELLGERCRFDVPMASLTTWCVGGPADCLVQPQSSDEIAAVFKICQAENEPVRVVGAGSNLLILDGGLRGVTILMRGALDYFRVEEAGDEEVHVTVGGALDVEDFSRRCVDHGVAGMEFIAGVPGSIGGGVRMNAGTDRGTFADILLEIEVVEATGRVRRLPREELVYKYRGLALDGPFVVTEAKLRGRRGDAETIGREVAAIIAKRRERQPWDCASCGSTFKNPEGGHAGKLIESTGLKGYRIGGAQVSEKHANFLINVGDATAEDLLQLIEHVRQTVFEKTGIWLEPEVKIWGERHASR